MSVKESDVRSHYLTARKMGVKEYSRNISKGRSGYLPFLEGVLKNIEIIYEADLGIVDIPLKKIVCLKAARNLKINGRTCAWPI